LERAESRVSRQVGTCKGMGGGEATSAAGALGVGEGEVEMGQGGGGKRAFVGWFAGLCGFCTFCMVCYTCATDGGPFRRELLTPWMVATLVDFYANVALIALWVAYRERASPLVAGAWLAALVCLGSMASAAYVAHAVLTLPAGDPVYAVLLAPQDIAPLASGRRTPLLANPSPRGAWRPVPGP